MQTESDKAELEELVIVIEGGDGEKDDTEAIQRAIDRCGLTSVRVPVKQKRRRKMVLTESKVSLAMDTIIFKSITRPGPFLGWPVANYD